MPRGTPVSTTPSIHVNPPFPTPIIISFTLPSRTRLILPLDSPTPTSAVKAIGFCLFRRVWAFSPVSLVVPKAGWDHWQSPVAIHIGARHLVLSLLGLKQTGRVPTRPSGSYSRRLRFRTNILRSHRPPLQHTYRLDRKTREPSSKNTR